MDYIRKAVTSDASRIAEILIFTKRMNYRDIFKNDKVSFGEMQVYPLAKSYIEDSDKLANVWVYDDGIVKGMLHIEGTQIEELYVDTFFENQGIGTELMEFAIKKMNCECLWVLERNKKAIHFYNKFEFERKISFMKKVILGSVMILAGLLSVAVLLAGTMANDWTINGQLSSFWNMSQYGLIPVFYTFIGIAIIGFAIAIWGIFEKKN